MLYRSELLATLMVLLFVSILIVTSVIMPGQWIDQLANPIGFAKLSSLHMLITLPSAAMLVMNVLKLWTKG